MAIIIGLEFAQLPMSFEQNMSDDVALPLEFTDAAANKLKA